jgi:amidase
MLRGKSMSLEFLSVIQQAKLIASRQISARELTEYSLAMIELHNADMHAFVRVLADEARLQAQALDDTLAKTKTPVGPLHGVPIAIKDESDVQNVPTSFGTNAVTTPASADSEAVRRLRAAGAIIIGKTAMPELGQWPFTESSTNGYTRNPWNRLYSTAGSSGGTAAAVASGIVAAGIGGDGGGSLRLPAAWCGLVGVKSQRGRISTGPHKCLWRGLGVIGPLTRTVADSALLFDLLAGNLPSDRYSAISWPEPLSTTITRDPGKLRILVAQKAPVMGGPSPDQVTLDALQRVADVLSAAGHHVEQGQLPVYKPGLTMMAQMGAGILDTLKLIDTPKRLETRTRRMLLLGRLLAPLSDRAERNAEELMRKMFTVFQNYSLVITPTSPHPAQPLGQLEGKGMLRSIFKSLPAVAYTSVWNVLGNPAAAIPAGFTADGLPLSVQLVAMPNNEPVIFQVAAQIEQAMPWIQRKAPLPQLFAEKP